MRTVNAVILEERAASFTKRSIKTSSKAWALRLAVSMIDLTTLEGADSPQKVCAVCTKARSPLEGGRFNLAEPVPSVAAVCVYPNLVAVAKRRLAGSGVKVASVATGFPSGQYPLEIRLADVRNAVEAGADEIDMVINRGALLAGRFGEVAREIREVRRACGRAHLKIILETGELGTYDMIRRVSDLAIDAAASEGDLADGEVFIKTSTGKTARNATLPVTLCMLEAIRDHFRTSGVRIGMKPAGGIRTSKNAIQYLVMVNETLGEAWLTPNLFRFGASSLLNDLLRQIVKTGIGRYPAESDFSIA